MKNIKLITRFGTIEIEPKLDKDKEVCFTFSDNGAKVYSEVKEIDLFLSKYEIAELRDHLNELLKL